ncbi:MAG TPA: hypothetical protein EYP85_01160 [Armatimonadetes bacterium]|nr:hypothetical protein [Armatimonadota bacterium]
MAKMGKTEGQKRWGGRLVLGLLLLSALSGAAECAETGPLVREVRLHGVTVFPSADLLPLLDTQPGEPLQPERLERDLRALEQYYHQRGYPYAQVTDALINSEGVLNITLVEGRIVAVEIRGNRHTKTSFLRRLLRIREGEVFSVSKLEADQQRLANLNLFRDILFTPLPGEEVGELRLQVEVKEAKTLSGFGIAGYSSEVGLVGYVDVVERNLAGRGQQLRVSWERGAYATINNDRVELVPTRMGYEVNFAAPPLIGGTTLTGLSVYSRAAQRFFFYASDVDPDNVRNYEWRRGVELQVGRTWGEQRRLYLTLRRERVDYDLVPWGVVPPRGYGLRPQTVSSLTMEYVTDTRNSYHNPQRGRWDMVGVQVAGQIGGGTSEFVKFFYDLRRYWLLRRNTVLAWRLFAGGSSGQVPLSELYWLGGGESLRGYYWNEFPGTRALLTSVELRFPAGQGLQWVTFLDVGYAWPQYRPLRPIDLQVGAGLGLRALTPFGPLRLDLAVGKDGLRSHFSTSQAF